MRQALDSIAHTLTDGQMDAISLPWHQIRYQHSAAIRAALAERYAPATANKMLAALRGVLRECRRLGLMTADDCAMASDIKPIRGHRLPAGRAITKEEIKLLMGACLSDSSILGCRDAAIFSVLRVGCRRSEVVALDKKDFDAGEGSLKVRGKGGKERLIYVPDSAIAHLQEWVECRGWHTKSSALFHPINRGGKVVQARRLTDQAIAQILNKRAEQAGITDVSCHDWRRTFIGDLLDNGTDIVTVQKLVGHSNPATTSRYDRRGEQSKKRAIAALDNP
jgi:site-specific recombinase XerD